MANSGKSLKVRDDLCRISIADLKHAKLLPPGEMSSATIACLGADNIVEKVNISIFYLGANQGYVEFEHSLHGETCVRTRVFIKSVPSNLGIGYVWYFVAPKTHLLCRILYLVDNTFQPREAVPGLIYKSQIVGKKWRSIQKLMSAEAKGNRIRTEYNGVPTKRYLRWQSKIERLRATAFPETGSETV